MKTLLGACYKSVTTLKHLKLLIIRSITHKVPITRICVSSNSFKLPLNEIFSHHRSHVMYMSSLASPTSSKHDHSFKTDGIYHGLTESIPHTVSLEQLQQLTDFIKSRKNIVCITGAGVSTSSGIPDYRGPQGSYNKGHKPIIHDQYMRNEHTRKKYWARSLYGWDKFSLARPNDCHIALNLIQKKGHINLIVTQNVDRLHQKSGAKNVIDLHGRNDQVRCMSCSYQLPREVMQDTLRKQNDEFVRYISSLDVSDDDTRADGDTELGDVNYHMLSVPNCPVCDGILKPNVVFFGDNVPIGVVNDIYAKIDQCDGVLVIGTSLEVFSGYRFVDRANTLNIPIAIVNAGMTRAERKGLPQVVLKVEGECASIMKQVLHMMD